MAAKKAQKKRAYPTGKLDRLYLALQKYVEDQGGTVLVAGPVRIVGRGRKYCHTFEIDFTGRLPDHASGDSHG